MILSFSHHYQDVVLISIFNAKMCIMFIVMQGYLKVKQTSTCSLNCEVSLHTVFNE